MNPIEELTYRWLDGALSADEQSLLARLIEDDDQARERHFEILRLEAALRGLSRAPDVTQPTLDHLQQAGHDDLERSVMRTIARLPQPEWSPHSPAPGARTWFAGLALTLAIGLAWWLLSQRVDKRPSDLPSLASLSERVEILNREGQRQPLDESVTIQPGQVVVAHDDDYAVLKYADGTRIELFGPSRLRVDETVHSKRLQLEAGSMHLDVRPQREPMIVRTPQGEVRVLGTRFRVAAGVERTRIEMEEGKVAFSRHGDDQTIELEKGAYVVAEQASDPIDVQPLPPTLVAPLWSHTKVTEALAMSAAGDVVAVGSRNASVLLLDVSAGELRQEIGAAQISGDSSSKLLRLAFADQDQRLVGITEHGHVIRVSVPGEEAELLDSWGATFALRLLSPDGALLGRTVGGGWQPKVRIWRLPPGGAPEFVRDIGGENDTWSTTFSTGGSRVAYGTRIGWVHLQEVDSGRELWRQQMGTNNIRQLGLSPNGQWLAAYSPGLGIQLWSLEDSTLAATWLPEGPAARSLVFSPDSQQLAAGLADRTVRFWSIPEGRPTLLIETGRGGAEQIAFTPDGRRLATVGHDTLALWELP